MEAEGLGLILIRIDSCSKCIKWDLNVNDFCALQLVSNCVIQV